MNSRSHIVHRGYVYGSDQSAPLERSAPLPRLRKRDWLMIAGILTVAAHAFGYSILSFVGI